MKSKIYYGLFATICVLSLTLSGCKENKPTDIGKNPAPPCINVTGTITGEDGSPIESIRIVADSSALNKYNWWQTDKEEYSDKDGSYTIFIYEFRGLSSVRMANRFDYHRSRHIWDV